MTARRVALYWAVAFVEAGPWPTWGAAVPSSSGLLMFSASHSAVPAPVTSTSVPFGGCLGATGTASRWA